jgi:hypothetical protein
MGRFSRPCLKCGILTSGESYCVEHKPVKIRTESPERRARKAQRYDSTYRRLAKYVRLTATRCHLCGEGPRYDDPWEADHLYPDQPGLEYELAPAHRSCNQRRGNKPLIGNR